MNTPTDHHCSAEDLNFENRHIWHPYTRLPTEVPPYPVHSADGVRLTLEDGREMIDGMASWWSAIHGYNHPRLNQAIVDQTTRMAHVMFGGLTHKPAIDLARKLVGLSPAPLNKVFFADSGSVAVEVAIKMALQYWQSRNRPERHRLLTVRGGYHGDTLGAMAVCDPVNGMHHLFRQVLPQHLFAPMPDCPPDQPWDGAQLDAMATLLEQHQHEIAAVILEPVVQGAGGMRLYHPDYLVGLRELCDRHDILLIFDEIATNFGRTGKMFATEHAIKADGSGISPDILCLGKALTGGYMTLSATLTTEQVADTISATGPFMHGPTFMANPLACAVAGASIDLLLESPWQENVARIEAHFRTHLGPLKDHPKVRDVRILGAIGVIETCNPVPVKAVQEALLDQGVWLRPFGHLLYTMPPYIMNDADLARLTDAMRQAVEQVL